MPNKDKRDSQPPVVGDDGISERNRLFAEVAKHREDSADLRDKTLTKVTSNSESPTRLARALDWVVENDKTIDRKRDIKIFYVYAHRHPATNVTFYVGKGVDSRAWNMFDRRPDHTETLYKLLKEGHPPGSWVSLVKWGLTEFEALTLEDQMIRDLIAKGVDLMNRTRPVATLTKGRTSGSWTPPPNEPRPRSFRAIALKDLKALDLSEPEDFRKAIEITLAFQPPDTLFLSMWELASRLKMRRGPGSSAGTKRKMIEAFETGIEGWFLDEYLYIRRDFETSNIATKK